MKVDCAGSFDEALLSGYLDGSLTQGQTQQVRLHLERCAACRELFAEMAALREATSSTEFEVPGAEHWPELPRGLWSRMGRRLGWTVMIAWLVVITGFALWRLATETGDPFEVFLVLGLPGAVGLLFLSVTIDRLRELKTDRYRGVQR
jgi:anti-sigma factor RsiW